MYKKLFWFSNKIKTSQKTSIFITSILSLIITVAFYSKAVFTPNKYLFNSSGDGLKNYYTYAYLIKNDTSFVNSKCVNYPFGEHISYLDCQPAIAIPLKVISNFFPGIANYSIGILNFLLVISIVITSVFLFLILKEYKVSNFFSIFSSIAITFLSPQFYRLSGHYGLFYTFAIPLIWLLIIKNYKTLKTKYSIFITIVLIIIFYLHAYLGIIVALFALFSYFFLLIFYKEYRSVKFIINVFIQIFIPIFLFLLINNITDIHTNRSDSPAGINVYNSSFNTIFLPFDSVLQKIYKPFIPIGNQQWEGVSYIGLVANVVIASWLLIFLFNIVIRRKLKTFDHSIPLILWVFIVASLVLLVISMVVPIKFIIQFVFEKIHELRQFRALGRFTWPFYYVIGVVTMIYIYNLYKKFLLKNKKILSTFLLVVPLFVFIAEALVFQHNFSKSVLQSPNYFNENYIPVEIKKSMQSFNKDRFQAIIPLPFFHYGSEDFMILPESADKAIFYSTLYAYHKNMQMMSSNSPRTSVDEAKEIIQILLPEFYTKSIKNKLTDHRPFLVLYTKNLLTPYEERILKLSKKFYEDENVILAKLEFDSLFYESKKEVLQKYLTINEVKYLKNNFFVSDTNAFIYYDGFDYTSSSIKHSGLGCYKSLKNEYNTLAEINAKDLDITTEYEVSFWFYNKGHGRNEGLIGIDEFDEKQGKSNWISITDARFSYIIVGDWSLVKTVFKPKDQNYRYKIFLAPTDNWVDSIYVDDILIKPVNVDVFRVIEGNYHKGILFYNNFYIETDIDYSVLNCRKSQIIDFYINEIKRSDMWYNFVKKDARKKGVTIDKHLYDNAEYMAYSEPFKIKNNKLLKIIYYKDLIKNNKEWLNKIVAENTDKITLDSLLMRHALYMIDVVEKSKSEKKN